MKRQKKAGAEYLESMRLINYTVTATSVAAQLKHATSTKQVKAKVIVGADGSNSTVARQMNGGKHTDEFQLLGLRAYYENVNGPTNRVDIYFTGYQYITIILICRLDGYSCLSSCPW